MEIISTVGVEGGQGMRSQQVGYFQVHTLPASADMYLHGNPDTGLGRRRRRVMLPKNSPGIERHVRRRPVHPVEKIIAQRLLSAGQAACCQTLCVKRNPIFFSALTLLLCSFYMRLLGDMVPGSQARFEATALCRPHSCLPPTCY